MKFEIRDAFPAPPDVLFASLIDADVEQRLAAMAQAERAVLDEQIVDGKTVRRVRFSSANPAFSQLARLIGSNTVTYEQHLEIDHAAMSVSWKMIPPAAADKLSAEGRFWVVPHAEGSERLVQGEVQVKIPMVGGALEGRVVDAIKKIYAKGSQYRRELLSRRT